MNADVRVTLPGNKSLLYTELDLCTSAQGSTVDIRPHLLHADIALVAIQRCNALATARHKSDAPRTPQVSQTAVPRKRQARIFPQDLHRACMQMQALLPGSLSIVVTET